MKIAAAMILASTTLMSCGSGGDDGVSPIAGTPDRMDCLAYIYLDSWAKKETGAITEQQFQDDATKISIKLQNRGDNYNYSGVFRTFNNRADRLIDADLTPDEAARKVEECRPIVQI